MHHFLVSAVKYPCVKLEFCVRSTSDQSTQFNYNTMTTITYFDLPLCRLWAGVEYAPM